MSDGAAWRPGIYVLASLDGRPLAMADRAVLDLLPGSVGDVPVDAAGCVMRIVEAPGQRSAVRSRAEPGRLVAMLGHLDEPEALAESLGLDGRSDPLDLALAALESFGEDAPCRLFGEWSIAIWRGMERELTLASSQPGRDRLYVAEAGGRVAVSPELRRLARLDWVDGGFDRPNLLLHLGRARMRRDLGHATILRGVTQLQTGTRLALSSGSRRAGRPAPPSIPSLWRGSDEEAIAEIDRLLRRIARQRLGRIGTAAVGLSGGLDSSLVALQLSQERGDSQRLVCLTSASPSGSGIPDETGWAARVAEHLGIEMVRVVPPQASNVFRPSDSRLRWAEAPLCGPRHYLDDALCDAAVTHGAEALFDGNCGELTVTSPEPPASFLDPVARMIRACRAWVGGRAELVEPRDFFHVRLSPSILADLPHDFAARWNAPFAAERRRWPSEPFGVSPGVSKAICVMTDSIHPRFRYQRLYLDPRLIALVAGMPSRIMHHGGLDRAPARAMMRARLPDEVRLRTDKMAFSPDYFQRLKSCASAASGRVPVYRAAGVGEWLDLDWLEAGLRRFSARGANGTADAFQVQTTSLAAEFFLAWNTRG